MLDELDWLEELLLDSDDRLEDDELDEEEIDDELDDDKLETLDDELED